MNKKYYLLLFFVVFISGILLYIGLVTNAELVPLGTYTLLVEQSDGSKLKYVFHSTDDYYVKTGCLDSVGSTISGCNVVYVPNTTVDGCPINNVMSTGTWNDCDSSWYRYPKWYHDEDCEYGADCDPNSNCKYGCSWGEKDYGTRGGIDYASVDGCAWYLQVFTENGTLLKEWSKPEETEGWREDRPFTTTKINDLQYKVDFPYTVVEDADACYYLKGVVRGSRYRYKLCVGNDWAIDDTNHCEEVLTKECALNCNYGQELNSELCECQDITPPQNECVVDLDCNNSSLECVEGKCVTKETEDINSQKQMLLFSILIGLGALAFITLLFRIKKKR